jgi:hypothetical protein
MTSWNEAHYERAQEFLRLIADAIPTARPGEAAAALPAIPAQAAAPTPPPPAPIPLPTVAPTAASVFKKIPWKK